MTNSINIKMKWLVLIFGLTCFFMIAFIFIKNDNKHQPTDNYRWIKISPQVVQKTLDLTGTLVAIQNQIISAPFDATIETINVIEGQEVNADDILLTLDSTMVDIQLRDALADKIKAKIELDTLNNWHNGTDVAKARRVLSNSESAIRSTSSKLKEARELYTAGIIARVEVDDLEQLLIQQQTDYRSATDELNSIMRKGQGEFKKMAELAFQNAEEKYNSLIKLSQNKVIKSPYHGVVIKPTESGADKPINIQKGSYVNQGMPLFEIVNPEKFNVTTKVDETDLIFLRKNQPVIITGNAFPEKKLTGAIESIGVQSNKSANPGSSVYYDVFVSVYSNTTADTSGLRAGMTAKLAIITAYNENAIVIPADAIHQDGDSFWVNYKKNEEDVARKVFVKPREVFEAGIEISGINEGYVEINNISVNASN